MEDCSVVKILNVDSLHRACSVEFAVAIAIKREDKLKLQEKVRLVFIIFFFKSPATKYKKQKNCRGKLMMRQTVELDGCPMHRRWSYDSSKKRIDSQ